MKRTKLLVMSFWLLFVPLAASEPGFASESAVGPIPGPDRPLTEPKTIVSLRDGAASPIPLEDLFASASGSNALWSADGQSIFYASNRGGALNLWRQPLAGGQAEQISDFPGAKGALRLTPDGQHLVYQADVGGRAIHDLYQVGLNRGEAPVNLTSTPEVSETYPLFSADGHWLAYASRAKDGASDNIVLMDRKSGRRSQLTQEATAGVHWVPVAFSQDGKTLIVNRYDYSMEFSEVHEVDTDTGAVTQRTPTGTYASASAITPDGRYIALACGADAGLRQAAILERRNGKTTLLQPEDWEQKTTDVSPDGTSLVFVTNENGRQSVYLHQISDGSNRKLSLPAGLNSTGGYLATLPTFSPDGSRLLFPHSAGSEPLDFWIHEIAEGKARRLTDLGSLQSHVLPRTSIVNYASFDGTVISGVLWVPHNLARDGQAPAVVIAHGGPTAQTMDQFNQTAVALASRGYLVLAPNFRGSTGYGQAFVRANQMDLGGGDLKDVVAGVDFLRQTGYVDARRVGIYGGSYGGYMVLMALAKTDVFATGVDMFGIVNWRTMWERGALDHRRYQASLVGEPATHPELYDRSSPLTYLEGLQEPLLVLQGENDTLVPAQESRQVVDYLVARRRTVEAKFYAEEGHGFAQPANQRDALERSVKWFERHLTAPPTAEVRK